MTTVYAVLSPDGIECQEFTMTQSMEYKLGGSPPMSSFGQAMYKGVHCDRSKFPLTISEDLAWP